jgi:PAS domain S-box-containing protein
MRPRIPAVGLAAVVQGLWSALPSGGTLPDPLWRQRCRLLIGLAWLHAVAIVVAGPVVLGYRWEPSLVALAEGVLVAVCAAVATLARAYRAVQASAIAIGLMSASAILVHLSGGYIEWHFHFFVMLVFLALLQDWLPFLLAVGYVAAHHGLVGVLWPVHVYNHPAALAAPWTWAAIHAGFVLFSCVGSVLAWRLNEQAMARTALILEAAGEGIFGVDADGRIMFMNQAAAAMLGTTARQAMGRPAGAAVPVYGTDRASAPEDPSPILSPLRDGEPRRAGDSSFGRAGGGRLPVAWRSTPIVERDRVTGVVVAFEDMTDRQRREAERKRVEQVHAEVEEQLRQSQKMDAIGRLAGGVAHDFNNLLTVISAQVELALREVPPPGQLRPRLQEVKEAAERAARLTGQLLAFSRKQILQPTVQSLNDIVSGLGKMLPRLIGEDIDVGMALASDLERTRVDRGQIEQVVMNLVVNARDAMPHGGRLTIETRNVVLDEAYARQHLGVTPGRHVMLAVSDTGCGMDEATRARVFDPFFTTKAPGQGTGLGLSTVYGIVAQSGGHVAVYSEPGRGATFKAYFPAVASSAEAASPEPETPVVRGHETVLLVEDEAMLRRAAREILELQGYQVLSAAGGHEAAQAAGRHAGPIHLLLTDVVMPEMSGPAVAARLATARPDMKVLYMSGYTDGAIAHHGVLEPGVAYLSKPFTIDSLTAKVRAVLDGDDAPRPPIAVA